MRAARVRRPVRLSCIGEAFTDLIFMGLDRVPQAGEELRTRRFAATVGGGAVITAVAASRLGLRTRVVSALGGDAVARLRAERVAIVNVIKIGEPAAVSVAISTRHDRSFVTFDGVNDRLERRLLERSHWLGGTPFVHCAFAPHDCRRWKDLLNGWRAAGATTSWDFGWHDDLAVRRGFGALLSSIDYVFVNEQEALMYGRVRTLRAAVAFWRDHARHTIIKLGAAGSRWVSADLDIHVPARRRVAVDTTGAGDAFNGGFLTAVARGLSPRECLRLANRVGTASTQKPGGLDGLPRR